MGVATGAAVFGSILTSKLPRAGNAGEMLHAYGSVFASAAAMMGVALLLALFLQEKPLSAEMIEIAEGRVDVPEY